MAQVGALLPNSSLTQGFPVGICFRSAKDAAHKSDFRHQTWVYADCTYLLLGRLLLLHVPIHNFSGHSFVDLELLLLWGLGFAKLHTKCYVY